MCVSVIAWGARPGPVLGSRRLLWDVKTVYGGTVSYTSARGRNDQFGGVAQRAHRVWPAYPPPTTRASAASETLLDQAHHPGSTPIEDRLCSFTPMCALVFGQYGEASADVHALVTAAAAAEARQRRRGSLRAARGQRSTSKKCTTAWIA